MTASTRGCGASRRCRRWPPSSRAAKAWRAPRLAVINAAGSNTFYQLFEKQGLRWNNGKPDSSVIDRYYHALDAERIAVLGHYLRELEAARDYTGRLAWLEELKTLPCGAVWDYHCLRQGVPVGPAWIEERQQAREAGLLRGLQLRKLASYPIPGADSQSVVLSIRRSE